MKKQILIFSGIATLSSLSSAKLATFRVNETLYFRGICEKNITVEVNCPNEKKKQLIPCTTTPVERTERASYELKSTTKPPEVAQCKVQVTDLSGKLIYDYGTLPLSSKETKQELPSDLKNLTDEELYTVYSRDFESLLEEIKNSGALKNLACLTESFRGLSRTSQTAIAETLPLGGVLADLAKVSKKPNATYADAVLNFLFSAIGGGLTEAAIFPVEKIGDGLWYLDHDEPVPKPTFTGQIAKEYTYNNTVAAYEDWQLAKKKCKAPTAKVSPFVMKRMAVLAEIKSRNLTTQFSEKDKKRKGPSPTEAGDGAS